MNLNAFLTEQLNELTAKLQKPGITTLEIERLRGELSMLNKLMQLCHGKKEGAL